MVQRYGCSLQHHVVVRTGNKSSRAGYIFVSPRPNENGCSLMNQSHISTCAAIGDASMKKAYGCIYLLRHRSGGTTGGLLRITTGTTNADLLVVHIHSTLEREISFASRRSIGKAA